MFFIALPQALQEQLTSSVQEIGHLIDPVSTAARGEAAQLGHKVYSSALTQICCASSIVELITFPVDSSSSLRLFLLLLVLLPLLLLPPPSSYSSSSAAPSSYSLSF